MTALLEEDHDARRRPAIGPSVLALVIALVSGYMSYRALGFPFRPRLAPLAFASITFLLSSAVLVAELLDVRRFRREGRTVREVATADDVPLGTADERTTRREWMAFAWLAALVASFFLLGFLLGMTVFMLAMMRLYGRERWGLSVAVTVGVMACIYLLFIRVLGVRVYTGALGDVLPFLPG